MISLSKRGPKLPYHSENEHKLSRFLIRICPCVWFDCIVFLFKLSVSLSKTKSHYFSKIFLADLEPILDKKNVIEFCYDLRSRHRRIMRITARQTARPHIFSQKYYQYRSVKSRKKMKKIWDKIDPFSYFSSRFTVQTVLRALESADYLTNDCLTKSYEN